MNGCKSGGSFVSLTAGGRSGTLREELRKALSRRKATTGQRPKSAQDTK